MRSRRTCVICDRNAPLLQHRTCGDVSCRNTYRQHLLDARPVCRICFRPLTGPSCKDGPICTREECRRVGFLLPGLDRPRCAVCRAPLEAGRQAGLCNSLDCRGVESMRQSARQSVELTKRRAAEYRRIVGEVRARMRRHYPEPAPLAVVPSFDAPVVDRAGDRERRFREHLEVILQMALDRPTSRRPPATTADDPTAPLLPGVCGLCRGSCCKNGGDDAYLTSEDVRGFMDENPDRTPERALQEYVDHLPLRSYQGSCIFHTTAGCNLSPSMRSATCRGHFCDGLEEFRRESRQREIDRVVVVAHDEREILRCAVVSVAGEERLPVPESQSEAAK